MMNFWDWAIAAYPKSGVVDACTHLQDGYGQNVCYLLWAAWAAHTGRTLSPDDLEAGADTARAWEGTAVGPLRAIRRNLKGPVPDMGTEARVSLRGEIKAAELQAEKHLMTDLQRLTGKPTGAPKPIAPALIEAARAWSKTVPRPALESLAASLSA
jgi:uncharacterized protein (TIGR02444 family)